MTYLLFVWKPDGWELRELDGEPPAPGQRLEGAEPPLVVSKVGASPLPSDHRRCVYTVAA